MFELFLVFFGSGYEDSWYVTRVFYHAMGLVYRPWERSDRI